MKRIILLAVLAMFVSTGVTAIRAEEEKVEIKQKKDGSWKMKVKRKGDKEFEGTYEGKTYRLRGESFTNFRDEGDYTVYGSISPDNTYIDTTRVERYEVRDNGTPVTSPDGNWRMKVTRHGEHDWVGVHDGKTYTLRGDTVKSIQTEGEYTVHGSIGTDGTFITTTKVERFNR